MDNCLEEWDHWKHAIKDVPSESLQGPSVVLSAMNKLKPTVGDLFPDVEKLCAAAVIPVSTAEMDRVFSDVNRTVRELGNCMKTETTHF